MMDLALVPIWLLLFLNLFLTLALIRRQRSSPRPSEFIFEHIPVGEKIPAFRVTSLSGEHISIDQIGNEYRFLLFVSRSCPSCMEKLKILQHVETQSELPVPIVVFSIGEPADAEYLVRTYGISAPTVVLEQGAELLKNFVVPGTPFFYEVDLERVVRAAEVDAFPWSATRIYQPEPATHAERRRHRSDTMSRVSGD